MQETVLLESKQLRDQAVSRIEVLEKVKQLFLIPDMEVMTIRQVSDYYEVDQATLRKCYQLNQNEIDEDGTSIKSYKEFLMGTNFTLENKEKGKVIISINESLKLEIPNRGIRSFSKRAILRIGMLLRDSPIAKEVRTQILNTLEASTPEQKTQAIDEEIEIQMNIGKAIMSGDIQQMNEAYTKAFEYKNRHIAKLQEMNNELVDDNKALAGEILTWQDRACINKAVRIISGIRNIPYGYVWKELYDELRYKHNIGLSQRGKPPFIQYVKEEEWPLVQQSFSAICENTGISPSRVMKKAKMLDNSTDKCV